MQQEKVQQLPGHRWEKAQSGMERRCQVQSSHVGHAITESQNHRMVGVGRDLCGSSSPTLLPKQGCHHPSRQEWVLLLQGCSNFLHLFSRQSLSKKPYINKFFMKTTISPP